MNSKLPKIVAHVALLVAHVALLVAHVALLVHTSSPASKWGYLCYHVSLLATEMLSDGTRKT